MEFLNLQLPRPRFQTLINKVGLETQFPVQGRQRTLKAGEYSKPLILYQSLNGSSSMDNFPLSH